MTAPLRLTYAIAPPNRATPVERRREIAAEQSARIAQLPIDALLVYDVQDEAARTAEPRPFPFFPKVDALRYAFDALQVGALPRVVYRAVAGQDAQGLSEWTDKLQACGGRAVLVGAPSSAAAAALPTSLSLAQAYELCRSQAPELSFGGVVIPERHQARGDEHLRVCSKQQQGCRFFVSQTVWSVDATKRLLRDLRRRCEQEGRAAPPILFTFSPCGSAQTLQFLGWLGVEVPALLQRELLGARDMLARSVELAADAFAEIHAFAETQGLSVGCNVESVTARAAEVDASIELLRRVHRQAFRPLEVDLHLENALIGRRDVFVVEDAAR